MDEPSEPTPRRFNNLQQSKKKKAPPPKIDTTSVGSSSGSSSSWANEPKTPKTPRTPRLFASRKPKAKGLTVSLPGSGDGGTPPIKTPKTPSTPRSLLGALGQRLRGKSSKDGSPGDAKFSPRGKGAASTPRKRRTSILPDTQQQTRTSENVRIEEGVSVKDALEFMHRILLRSSFKEMIFFIMFYAVFVVIVMDAHGLHIDNIYKQDKAIEQVLIDNSFDVGYIETFEGISKHEDIWAWILGVWAGGIFVDEKYNGDPIDPSEVGYLANTRLKFVGNVRMRQFRIKGDSCQPVSDTFKNRDGTCWSHYSVEAPATIDSTTMYTVLLCRNRTGVNETGPVLKMKLPADKALKNSVEAYGGTCWQAGYFKGRDRLSSDGCMGPDCYFNHVQEGYRYVEQGDYAAGGDPELFVVEGLSGWQTAVGLDAVLAGAEKYGTGSIVVDLDPVDTEVSVAILESLMRDRFTDRGTRALVFELNLYSSETKLLSAVRIMIEVFNSGFVLPSSSIYTFRIRVYDTSSWVTILRIICEPLFAICIVYQAYLQVDKFINSRPLAAYINITNMHDLIVIASSVLFMYNWYEYVLSPSRLDFDSSIPYYKDFIELMSTQATWTWGAACAMAIFGALRVLVYLSIINSTLFIIAQTIVESVKAMSVFFLSVGIVFLAFALGAVILYGPHIRDFHTLPSALSKMMRIMLGDFDYGELDAAQPYYTWMYFWPYTIIVSFILINIFIAIVCSLYESIRSETTRTAPWKRHSTNMLMEDVTIFWHVLMLRGCRMSQRLKCGRELTPEENDSIILYERQARFELLLKQAMSKSSRAGVNLHDYFEQKRLSVVSEDPSSVSFGDDAGDPIGYNRSVSLDELLRLVPDAPDSNFITKLFRCGKTEDKGLVPTPTRDSTAIKLVRAYSKMKTVNVYGPRGRLVLMAKDPMRIVLGDSDGGEDGDGGNSLLALMKRSKQIRRASGVDAAAFTKVGSLSLEADDEVGDSAPSNAATWRGRLQGKMMLVADAMCCRFQGPPDPDLAKLEIVLPKNQQNFLVTKIDRWGRSQWRLFVIDHGTLFECVFCLLPMLSQILHNTNAHMHAPFPSPPPLPTGTTKPACCITSGLLIA